MISTAPAYRLSRGTSLSTTNVSSAANNGSVSIALMTIPVADLSFDRMPPHIDGTFTPMHRREGVLKRMVEVIAGGEKNDFGLGNHRNMLGEP